MIVYSFALRDKEPNPCNIRLARAAKRIIEELNEPVLVVAQRTVSLALKQLSVPDVWVVEKRPGYEGSEEVTRQAARYFREEEIKKVIPIAQPFLQLTECVQLVRKAGFRTWSFWRLVKKIGWIGFDRRSVQPWTRGPVRLVFYTFRQMFFGYRPPPELSE